MNQNGIILLAYGSPENLDYMGEFLSNIRGGKEFPQEVVQKFRQRYELTGGPSPLNAITRSQAKALNLELKTLGKKVPVYVGMAYCPPFISEAVQRAKDDGVTHLIGLPMAPHASNLSTGKYKRFFIEACEKIGFNAKPSFIDHWYDEENVIQFFSQAIQNKMGHNCEKPFIVFTAHSLPERVIAERDPYPDQVKENVQLIVKNLGLSSEQYSFAYQSQGQGKEPWLGPSIEEKIGELGKRGIKNVLICPIGFACDHIEVLYDIDIQAKNEANKYNLKLDRTDSLNIDPLFISSLAHKVSQFLE